MEKPPKFVPYEKLSKKDKRRFDQKSRADWGGVRPVTQVFSSDKDYNRHKRDLEIEEELEELDDEES